MSDRDAAPGVLCIRPEGAPPGSWPLAERDEEELPETYPLSLPPQPPANPPPRDAHRFSRALTARDEDAEPFEFTLADPHLAFQATRLVRAIYTVDGREGLAVLERDVLEGDRGAIDGPGVPVRHEPGTTPGDATSGGGPPGQSPQLQIFNAIRNAQREMFDMLEPVVEAVQTRANLVVARRLAISGREIERQTRRYFSRGLPVLTAAPPGKFHVLDGPDVHAIAEAILRLDAVKLPLEGSERASAAVSALYAFVSNPITGALVDQGPAVASVLGGARDLLAAKVAVLASYVAGESQVHPVLFQAFVRSDFARAAAAIAKVGNNEDGLRNCPELSWLLVWTLGRALSACTSCEVRIAENPTDVWRYQPLINDVVRELGITTGTVEWQRMHERLCKVEESVITMLARYAMDAELALMFTPPLAAAIAPISLLLQVLSLLDESERYTQDKNAFDSTLDPSRSFASEASAIALLIGIAFTILAIPGGIAALK